MSFLNMSVEQCDDDTTWEEFFGQSTDLMPTIMGAFEAIIENTKHQKPELKTSCPKRTHQAGNFANLSPGVQKILSHVPDQEISKSLSSEESLSVGPKRYNSNKIISNSTTRVQKIYKSSESLDFISPNVQKMISNFPDNELVIAPSNVNNNNNNNNNNNIDNRMKNSHSFVYSKSDVTTVPKMSSPNVTNCNNNSSSGKTFLHRVNSHKETFGSASSEVSGINSAEIVMCDSDKHSDNCESYCPKPLGSYLHTSPHGIASRTPVGRKNMGKYLQVPSESSVGTSSSTASSEVSRPVSLTSLGSCSSSGSSGPHQPGSAYLASAESLDSDPEPTGSQGSADSGIAEQPTVSPEMRVLQEVLDTETVYVADLNEVIQGYLEPWSEETECPLVEHLPDLFSNIKKIYEFNSSFLEQLREADSNPTKIANVFLQNDSGFSVYNEYCTNYPRTMDVLSELTRDEKMAPLFREKQIALSHALPLGSYLLKPVQRILKYHLLLQRLSKQCESEHKPVVDLALTTMTGIACGINTMKRKHEHAVRVQEIQSQLYGWPGPDLTALGELVAEGIFRVNGARGRRHVFLFDKVLLIAKSKQDGALAYKSHIMSSNLMIVEHVRGEPLSFQVLPFDNPRLACTLRARSPQHKREWTLQIKRVMLENYTAVIPSHARQLVLQLGQDVQENVEDNNDKWSPLKQYSTPHYLERRSRVRKTRELTNRRASSQDRTFPTLGWRRKSEPSMVPQYTTKTVPKKISKIKKSKESGATFYTDLSDSETCDLNGESFESLQENIDESANDSSLTNEDVKSPPAENNIEKIVSDLLMQNTEFQKIMHRQRRNLRESDPTPTNWFEEERNKLPSKADSLPRSFQLNDQIGSNNGQEKHTIDDESVKEYPDNQLLEEQHENDLSSQVADTEYPEHKIYRNTGIRISLLQRIQRAITSEEQKQTKYPLHKQGSRSMGEKLAHPDYVDPQKLFLNASRSNLNSLHNSNEKIDDFMDEPERLDMSVISEKEVLKEFEKRLNNSTNNESKSVPDTGQCNNNSSHSIENLNLQNSTVENIVNSSQNSDSYYESILDENLVEEYVKDENGKKVLKQDSFRNVVFEKVTIKKREIDYSQKTGSDVSSTNDTNKSTLKKEIKRPTKAPPPIPVKPTRLITNQTLNNTTKVTNVSCKIENTDVTVNKMLIENLTENSTFTLNNSCSTALHLNGNDNSGTNPKSWVKAMVGRFE